MKKRIIFIEVEKSLSLSRAAGLVQNSFVGNLERISEMNTNVTIIKCLIKVLPQRHQCLEFQ